MYMFKWHPILNYLIKKKQLISCTTHLKLLGVCTGHKLNIYYTRVMYCICVSHTALFLSSQYNIKKKEEIQELPPEEPVNPLMRKKKTPEELAREAEEADEDEFTSKFKFSDIHSSLNSSFTKE